MSKFKFSESERQQIREIVYNRDMEDDDTFFGRIEQIVSERDVWIDVDDVNERGYYLCVFENVQHKLVQCVVSLEYVTRHSGSDSPIDKRFYAFPGMGHEIKPIILQPLPSPPKQPTK